MKISYPEQFKDLVKIANQKSLEHYQGSLPEFNEFEKSTSEDSMANPYYIGFGNPAASILIFGKEKVFNPTADRDQHWRESIANPSEWENLIAGNINNKEQLSYPNHIPKTCYKNALYPYDGKMGSGHTWSKYQKIIDHLYPLDEYPNSFLSKAFISEINHEPSKKSVGYKICPNRIDFIKSEFYKTFPITILGCGNYLKVSKSKNEIEDIFNVKYFDSKSYPRQKLEIYKNEKDNRILIHTRQLSMDVTNDLLERISMEVKNYI